MPTIDIFAVGLLYVKVEFGVYFHFAKNYEIFVVRYFLIFWKLFW